MSVPKQLEDVVFFAALHVTDSALRKGFLDQACAGNPALRSVVEEMLASQEDAERLIDRGRSTFTLTLDEVQTVAPEYIVEASKLVDEQVGTRIGRYKLLQKIGEGGCGVVYMAEQEEPVRRRVALKVIKLGMDTKSVIARFDAERQALALMDHPNIARVLDAGATNTGRPYFVMELVRGVRITEYCDQNHLDTRQRLELFIRICHAIQHAHQKGVIHRDIKPSNILVTMHDGAPVPKVIDFGIAKAIEGRLTEQTLFTAYEQLVGTPAYMSPEQAEMSGLDVDTRSDIYSLGVLLYELLAGRTPFDGKELVKSGLDEMRRTLREKEPQRPSNILTTLHGTELKATAEHRHSEAPKLISLLKGDLDWIVMKALEKDRTRRYETANGLAMDAQRYLNNEPVVARPPSRLYRLQKLVRRNKIAFASGAAVVVALVIGLGASTFLFFKEKEAWREQARSREQAEQAEKRENELRLQAEAKEKINQSAIYVSQEKYEEADHLLDEIKTLPSKPSFDGVNAYRRVGEWLALQGRWREAANRFFPLMQIDRLDEWQIVTLDYQACGAALVECGDQEHYARFCQTAVANYGATTNGDMAGRILKTCLLLPPDKELMAQLQAMANVAEKQFAPIPAESFPPWALIHLSLWDYRRGACDQAEAWCRRFAGNGQGTALEATIRIIMAMSYYKEGQADRAHTELAKGHSIIDAKFHTGLDRGSNGDGFWYDWVFARLLQREADSLIGK